MPKLTIDGREIEVEPGTTVIRAAERLGITIPHYCWHPGLTIAGNCRMCLVEIEKMPKLTTACSTLVAEGMIVRTSNPRVKEAQDAIMEFLLINHPLDCPICDQAGECRLQQYSFRYGPGGSRFLEEKVHKPKNVDLGAHIVLDAERCIACSRCVRFCNEISKTGELTLAERSDHVVIETFPGRRLDNAYSGNTVDICPVGALTLKEFRFKQRVWFLKDVPSVCGGCARGCSVMNGVSKGRILRITPRENPEINQWWICDEGRLSYEKLYASGRIEWPRVAAPAREARAAAAVTAAIGMPVEGGLEAAAAQGAPPSSSAAGSSPFAGRRVQGSSGPAGASFAGDPPFVPIMNEGVAPAPHPGGPKRPGETVMAVALDAAAKALGDALAAGGMGSVEFVFSARATNEDLFVLGRLARDLFGARRVALPSHERDEDDALLIRKDRTPNRRGALAILEGLGLEIQPGDDLVQRVASGAAKAVVCVGPGLLGARSHSAPFGTSAHLFERLVAWAEGADAPLIAIDAFESPLTTRARIVLPALTYGEIEGTWTNFEGRVQRLRSGLPPAADGLPVYRIAQEIGRRLGVPPGRTGAQETFSALATEIPAFAGLSYAKLGERGAPIAGAERRS